MRATIPNIVLYALNAELFGYLLLQINLKIHFDCLQNRILAFICSYIVLD